MGPRIRVSGVLKRNDEILLIEHSKDSQVYYLLPGGGADGGLETLSQSLVREFEEELCMKVAVGELLMVAQSVAPDGSRNIVHMIFEVFSEDHPLVGENEDRVTGFLWFSVHADPNCISFRPNILLQVLEQMNKPAYNGLQPIYPEWIG